MARLFREVQDFYLITELQAKAEEQYPRLHRDEDSEKYLAAVIDVAMAEIKELRTKAILQETHSATVPRAVYDAQTRECLVKTGAIKRLVRENEHLREMNLASIAALEYILLLGAEEDPESGS